MEELIALVVQIVVEVLLQLVGSIGFDWATKSRRGGGGEGGEEDTTDSGGWLVLFAVLGGLCGALSTLVAPNLILPGLGLRVANLVASPLVAGGLSYLVASRVWSARGFGPRHHFWRGFCFALAFGLIRFASAHG